MANDRNDRRLPRSIGGTYVKRRGDSYHFGAEGNAVKKESPMTKLTKTQAKDIANLRKMKDEDIDLSDIPEITDWSNAVVGKFYRPVKQSLTIRLDADVIAWLKSQGRGYQTRINSLLRNAMAGSPRRRA
jgi:uncharacterized protein (DUF4415 family)